MILELLLLSPDPILISPHRKQIRFRVDVRAATNMSMYLHARPPEPQKQLVRLDDRSRLHIAILRTCKQLNQEGTALLYGKNSFVVGRTSTPLFPSPSPQPLLSNSPTTHPFLFVPSLLIHTYTPRLLDMMPFKTRGSSAAAVEDGFRAVGFFPWYLRLSTLAQIPSITFRKACHCDTWVILNNKEYKTDGEALRKTCFSGWKPGWLLPSPKEAKAMFRHVNTQILNALHPPVFVGCPWCLRQYGLY